MEIEERLIKIGEKLNSIGHMKTKEGIGLEDVEIQKIIKLHSMSSLPKDYYTYLKMFGNWDGIHSDRVHMGLKFYDVAKDLFLELIQENKMILLQPAKFLVFYSDLDYNFAIIVEEDSQFTLRMYVFGDETIIVKYHSFLEWISHLVLGYPT